MPHSHNGNCHMSKLLEITFPPFGQLHAAESYIPVCQNVAHGVSLSVNPGFLPDSANKEVTKPTLISSTFLSTVQLETRQLGMARHRTILKTEYGTPLLGYEVS